MLIRSGTPADYAQVTDQVVASFRTHTPAHVRFEDFDPASVNPSPEAMSHWLLAFVDGRMAGGLMMVPRRLRIGETEIVYGGIGHVHCHPAFRNHGVFSALMKECVAQMRRQGIPLSALGGDRLRYGHYGWEHCGCQRTLELDPAMLRFRKHDPEPTILDFREYRGAEKDTRRILEARKSAGVYAPKDSLEELALLLSKPGRITYLWEGGDGAFAYAILRNRSMVEYGGCVEGVEKVVRYILQTGAWTACVPPAECDGPLEEMLEGYAQSSTWTTTQFRVNLLKETLEAYRPWLEERLLGWNGSVVIRVDDGGDSENVEIAGGSEGLAIVVSRKEPTVSLRRVELSALLFGPGTPKALLHDTNAFWRRAFPLPLCWPDMEHV